MREIVMELNDGTFLHRSITVQSIVIEDKCPEDGFVYHQKRWVVEIMEYNAKNGNEKTYMHESGMHETQDKALEIMKQWQPMLEDVLIKYGHSHWICTSNRTVYGSVGHDERECMDEQELRRVR